MVLVEVAVQPTFVAMDGDTVVEKLVHPIVMIPANEWPTYSSERFPREVKAWQTQLDRESGPKLSPKPKLSPNRATRRAKAKATKP
jgi:hypothetical protein